MSKMDIYAMNSFVIDEVCNCTKKAGQTVYAGNGNSAGLYFDLSKLCEAISIYDAKLVLFNVPIENKNKYCLEGQYEIAPLLDFISIYEQCSGQLRVAQEYGHIFDVQGKESYLEIDITEIVKAWVSGELENRGGVIYPLKPKTIFAFAGSNFYVKQMRPFIRVKYAALYPEKLHPNIIELPAYASIISEG